jgi:hypothetical protein
MPQAAQARLRADRLLLPPIRTRTLSISPWSPGSSFNAQVSERDLRRSLQFSSR